LLFLLEEAGLRAGLVHFPESVSAKTPHFQLAPYWGRPEPSPFELCPPAVHTTLYAARTAKMAAKQQKLGWPPASALAYHEKGNWRPIAVEAGQYRLRLTDLTHGSVELKAVPSGEELLLHIGDAAIALRLGEWSQWMPVSVDCVQGKVRFYLGKYEPEKGIVEIVQSQVMRLEGISNDLLLESKLMAQLGPFISKWAAKVSATEEYCHSAIEEAEYQAFWLADSAIHLTHNCNISLWATVYRLIDESQHNCLGQYDPASPFFEVNRAKVFGDIMRECYQVLDRTMGRIMAAMDSETTLFLVSDHGGVPNAYMCDIYRYLARFGLVNLDDTGSVIIEESKVYLKDERGGLEIYVNLRGREPHGIVSQEEYELIRETVLHALGSWRIEENGQVRNAISVALKKEDAAGLGYWGQYAGDIILAYNTGFVWGVSASGEDICPVAVPGANHGPQKPTAETDVSSNYGVLLAYGSAIRQGYYREKTTCGPYRMVDPAATIAQLLGLNPASLDGAAMSDLIKSEGDIT
jgi:hypothetical protein